MKAYTKDDMTHERNLIVALNNMLEMHDMMMSKVNHSASFYDAATIAAMNEQPAKAREVLKAVLKADRERPMHLGGPLFP